MYASMVRGIVLYHAHHLKLLTTYGAIASATKVLPRGGQLAQAIALITEDDHKAKRPLSTAVVVNSKTGRPGSGFFIQCRQLGFEIGESDDDELDFWYAQLFKLGVQPVTLEGFGDKGDSYMREVGSLSEMRQAARNSVEANRSGHRPGWAAAMKRGRQDKASAERPSEPCSGLPGAD